MLRCPWIISCGSPWCSISNSSSKILRPCEGATCFRACCVRDFMSEGLHCAVERFIIFILLKVCLFLMLNFECDQKKKPIKDQMFHLHWFGQQGEKKNFKKKKKIAWKAILCVVSNAFEDLLRRLHLISLE